MTDDYEQWRLARLGKATASRICDVIAKTKTGWSAYRRKYMIELMAERLTGMPTKQFLSEAMLWGNATEPEARQAYQRQTGNAVETVWFIEHPTIKNSGASPDGFVGTDGLLEIKCPETATHLTFLLEDKINPDYVTQMQWQIACTNRQWCDFASYDPRLVEPLRLKIQRVMRDVPVIAELEKSVTEFLAELDAAIKSLGGPFGSVAPPPVARAHHHEDLPTQPMNTMRQIRPEDEDNWKPTPLNELRRK